MKVIKAPNFVVLLQKCVTKRKKLGLVMLELKIISDSVYEDLFLGFPPHKSNFFFLVWKFNASFTSL